MGEEGAKDGLDMVLKRAGEEGAKDRLGLKRANLGQSGAKDRLDMELKKPIWAKKRPRTDQTWFQESQLGPRRYQG